MNHSPRYPSDPKLSVIIGVLNGAAYIEGCLDSVYAQGLGQENFEILLLDGGSEDDTVTLAENYAAERGYKNLHIFPNPRVTLAAAFNIGKDLARAPYIAKVDAQGRLGENYHKVLLKELEANDDIALIGGFFELDGDTALAKAWAPLFADPFLVGPARYRYIKTKQENDAVLYGIYRKSAMDETGDFDEAILRAEDTDFNYRMRQKGWKIFIQPEVETTYFVRRTLPQAYKQFFNYAYWRTMFQFKHGLGLKVRQIVPMLWLFGMVDLLLLSFVHPLWALPLAAYFVLAFVRAKTKMIEPTPTQLLQGTLLFPTLHGAYAVGSALATFRHYSNRERLEPKDEEMRVKLGYPAKD